MTARRLLIACALASSVVLLASAPARAASNEMGDVLVDGFYGGLIGALVGAAVMVLTDDPGDHLQYMTTGAGIGVIAGTAYGLTQVARYALINVDDGHLAWGVPTIGPLKTSASQEAHRLTLSAALVHVRF